VLATSCQESFRSGRPKVAEMPATIAPWIGTISAAFGEGIGIAPMPAR